MCCRWPGQSVHIVFVDFAKAFDRVDHNVLMSKLVALNLPDIIIRWMYSYTDFYSNTGWPKNGTIFMYPLNLPNINRFSDLFHSQNQEKNCNNTIAKNPTTHQVCRYTTLWNVSHKSVENKTTSVTSFVSIEKQKKKNRFEGASWQTDRQTESTTKHNRLLR